MNQIEKVKARINEVGYVDNFWAIDNYILRLRAIIFMLKREGGMNLRGSFGKQLGKDKSLWKNYYYILDSFKESKQIFSPTVENFNSSPAPVTQAEEQGKLW